MAWGLGWLQGGETERRYQTPAAYEASAKRDAERVCGTGPGAFECIYEKVEATKEQASTEQDLSAQQRAANAALASAIISFATLVVTAVGVAFVKSTLDATWKAVEDTGDATQAMRESNEIARIEKRPWLKIEVEITKATFAGDCLTLRHRTTVTNVGQMVAERCSVRGSFIENDGKPSGKAEIERLKSDAERVAGIRNEAPQMPYPILPGETKSMSGQVAYFGDLSVRTLDSGKTRTTYIVFVCARYFVPGENQIRITDRAFSVDYTPDPDDIFGPYGIPVPIPDDLSPEMVMLRPIGHHRTT
jgi:hypothetical protein